MRVVYRDNPVWQADRPAALSVGSQTPPAALAGGPRQGAGARPGGRPGHGRSGIVHPEWQTSNAGLERGRRAPPKPARMCATVRRPGPIAPRGTARFLKPPVPTAARPGARNEDPTQPVWRGFSRLRILRARLYQDCPMGTENVRVRALPQVGAERPERGVPGSSAGRASPGCLRVRSGHQQRIPGGEESRESLRRAVWVAGAVRPERHR